jgi:hypothetical protein
MTYTQVWDHMRNQPHDSVIQRDIDGAFIPADPGNMDYQEYLAWFDAGNEPKAATPPEASLPETVPVEDRVGDLEARVDQLENYNAVRS